MSLPAPLSVSGLRHIVGVPAAQNLLDTSPEHAKANAAAGKAKFALAAEE